MLCAGGLLRWQAAMISVAALGFALVFALSLWTFASERRVLAWCAALAVALGAGWALVTGTLVALSHDVALNAPGTDDERLLTGIGVPAGSALLMVVPAVVFGRRMREPLRGYVIGAWGAVVFTAAATLARLAPQFATGVTTEERPVAVLLVQAGIQGLALPVTAAALGGMVGITVVLGRRAAVIASVLVALAIYTIMGVTEFLPMLHGLHLAVHVVLAAIALWALGVAQRAVVSDPAAATVRPVRVLATFTVGAAVVAAAGSAVALLITPDLGRIECPPDCGRPPIGEPIESNPRFYAEDGAFSVQYPGAGSAYEATMHPDGVELDFVGGDTGTLELFGLPAENRTAEQVAEDLIDQYYPEATTEYEIPNAMVGYEPGYGVVADDYPQDANGTFTRLRLIVVVAVRNDYALVAAAIGPYREFTQDFGTGHPSGANLQLAMDMGKYVNSFRWGGTGD
ncbi:zinc ribbon domain-containing protein [Mycolicibacterium flavescens]|nr:zinc ribbon domain-containing protein [Mycolicibacterium flavescens]